MKKLIPVILCCAMLLAACGSSADSTSTAVSSESSSAAESTIGGADGPTDIVISESTDASTGEEANTANLDAAVAAIEAVNPIANPRALDDFSVENELMLTMDNLVGYKGDVTNDQADCGLVFVAQAKDGQVDAVKAELENGTRHVFDCSTFTVKGETLTSSKADVDTDPNYTPDTEAIVDGYFAESTFRSAPYFDLQIDGINLLDTNFGG